MLPYRQAIGDPKQVMENRQVHETLESCVTTLRRLAFEVKTLARWNFSFSIYLFIYFSCTPSCCSNVSICSRIQAVVL